MAWPSAAWAAPWAGADCRLPRPGRAGGWAGAQRQARQRAPVRRQRAARSTMWLGGRERGSLLLAHRGENGLVCLVLGRLDAAIGRRHFACTVDVQFVARAAAQYDNSGANNRRRGGARRADQPADLRILREAVAGLGRRVLRSRVAPVVVDVLKAAKHQ